MWLSCTLLSWEPDVNHRGKGSPEPVSSSMDTAYGSVCVSVALAVPDVYVSVYRACLRILHHVLSADTDA